MKFNGTIFSKPQQDQLKENIGNELEKALAATKYKKYELDLSTSENRNTLISLSQIANQGKRVIIIHENLIYSVNAVSQYSVRFERTKVVNTASYTPLSVECINIEVRANYAKMFTIKINTDGTYSNSSVDINSVTLLIEG